MKLFDDEPIGGITIGFTFAWASAEV